MKAARSKRPGKKNAGNQISGPSSVRGGMPAFVPTEEQRTAVEIMVGCGLPHETIRLAVLNPRTHAGVSKEAFAKAFAVELEHGRAKVDMIVAASMFGQIKAHNTAMTIWYQKNRWKWTDRSTLEGNPDKPLEGNFNFAVRFVKGAMTREEAFRQ